MTKIELVNTYCIRIGECSRIFIRDKNNNYEIFTHDVQKSYVAVAVGMMAGYLQFYVKNDKRRPDILRKYQSLSSSVPTINKYIVRSLFIQSATLECNIGQNSRSLVRYRVYILPYIQQQVWLTLHYKSCGK